MNTIDTQIYDKAYEHAVKTITVSEYAVQERLRHDSAMEAVRLARIAREKKS